MDIHDPLSPSLPIVHCFQQVILPLLIHVKGRQEYIPYELVPTSLAVSHMSGSSNFDSFCDGW